MEERELICIQCPLGCPMQVALKEGKVTGVAGNTCKRGALYAEKECVHPTRIVTSSVRVVGGTLPMVSVKTETDIPKEKMEECMNEVRGICVSAPVSIGQIIRERIAGTSVNLVATKNIELES